MTNTDASTFNALNTRQLQTHSSNVHMRAPTQISSSVGGFQVERRPTTTAGITKNRPRMDGQDSFNATAIGGSDMDHLRGNSHANISNIVHVPHMLIQSANSIYAPQNNFAREQDIQSIDLTQSDAQYNTT